MHGNPSYTTLNGVFSSAVTVLNSAVSTQARHIKLAYWLQATIHPQTDQARSARDLILQIRAESNESRQKELKRDLPAVAVSCLIREGQRRTHEHIESLTGWMQFDIDPVDNPQISSWPDVRTKLAGLAYVAYVGLSVRGNGVWGLVKVKHPDKLALHFEQFIHDMYTGLGLKLDSTKGGNPTDLRFYSYDPQAVIKDQFKIYDRLPEYYTRKIVRSRSKQKQSDVFDFAYNYARKYCKKPGAFNDGNRHYFIYTLCCALNRKGVPQHEAESYINANLIPLDKVTSNCITDPYQRFKNEFGTWKDDDYLHELVNNQLTESHEHHPPTPYGFNPHTGEVFDQRGYPADWDDVLPPDEGTPGTDEVTRIGLADTQPGNDDAGLIRLLADTFDAVIDTTVSPDVIKAFWKAQEPTEPSKAWRSMPDDT
jgi:hypothetical protein